MNFIFIFVHLIAGKSNEMDKNEDEIHQDKLGHAHTEEDTPND